ncbi:MAG: hypothetical protein ACFBRM_10180 [Pikeienuella sp.]
MLFNVEADQGHEIVGYLVPDSFTDIPRLALFSRGQMLWAGQAAEPRPALVASGRHRTGQCGFRIGPTAVPDLAQRGDVELRCMATGLTIYRRFAGRPVVARRVFRLETRCVPLTRFDRELEPFFQAWHPQIDRYGAETIDQLFLLNGRGSSYASGRLQVPGHGALADGSVAVLLLLRDPFEELAERLSVLSGARGPVARHLPLRERLALAPAIEAVRSVDLAAPRALRRAIRRLDEAAAAALSNPLTRQLTRPVPGELCAADAVATALRTLSSFDLVSVADLPGYFETGVGALLGVPAPLPIRDPHAAEIGEIADTLSRIGAVEAMLECDLEVYASASGVFERLAAGGAQG